MVIIDPTPGAMPVAPFIADPVARIHPDASLPEVADALAATHRM